MAVVQLCATFSTLTLSIQQAQDWSPWALSPWMYRLPHYVIQPSQASFPKTRWNVLLYMRIDHSGPTIICTWWCYYYPYDGCQQIKPSLHIHWGLRRGHRFMRGISKRRPTQFLFLTKITPSSLPFTLNTFWWFCRTSKIGYTTSDHVRAYPVLIFQIHALWRDATWASRPERKKRSKWGRNESEWMKNTDYNGDKIPKCFLVN